LKAAAGEARQFPWERLIALGLGLLRLSPRDFWAMTPRELAHVLRAFGAGEAGAPSRASLEAMMNIFPDREVGNGAGNAA
jgi:uncharacterized phage protein (TIGR02216 family)